MNRQNLRKLALVEDPYIRELIACRMEQGLTLEWVAEATGVNRGTLTRWENELASPRIGDYAKWAATLGKKVIVQ